MQGERSILKPFPETIDLNQVSGSNNASTDRPVAWSNVLNPVESRLSSYVPSSGHGNPNFSNPASHNGRTFSGWDPGESSSSANMQSQLNGHDSKVGQGWSPSINTRVGPEGRSADWQFEQPNVLLHESGTNSYRGNYFHRPLSISNSVSTRTSPNATVSGGYQSSSYDSWQGRGSGISPTFYRSGMSEIDQFATFDAGSTDVGTSSSSSGYLVRHDDGSVSSSSTWGLSCKRKVLEGNPGQSGSTGSLSVEPQDETIGRHTFPAHHDSSSSLAVSATSTNSPSANSQGQVNTRIASGMRGMTYDRFPSRVTEVAESSQRNFSFGVDLGRQEPTQFDLSAAGSDVRHSNTHSTSHQSRLISATESPELRAPFSRPLNLNSNPSQSPFMHVHGLARNRPPVSWSGSLNSRGGASSSPILFSGERGAAVRDEANFRSSLSNNPEHPSFVAARESRHMVQEPTAWSFSPGNSGSSRNVPSSSRYTPNSGTGPFSTVWMPHQNVTAHNQQRLSEFPPWTLFPSVEPDPGGQRSNFSFLPSASSSSEEAVMSSGSSSGDHNQPYSRSLLMEVSSDDINGWRALAAGIEGRHRIVSEIRQVLNAMRRAEYLRAEDYMMLDPFINGAAELHDRHRDMRLDVDNMSYEELLALEERIGNVSTGLSDNAILDALKHRRHQFVTDESPNLEPCCICQEEYRAGDDIGTLNCGHEFHTNCIKQWLTMKNLCPICKTTALET